MRFLLRAYLDLLKDVIENGNKKEDRTGIGTLSVFGRTFRCNLAEGFPAVTTKRLFYRGVIEELLWFLRGQTDSKILEAKGINIWKGNTTREFLDQKGLESYPEGEAGPIYGAQWAKWDGKHNQIEKLIKTIKENPNSRRLLVSAWNVSDLDKMALPPCHYSFLCNVTNGKLSLMWTQRSVDLFLGASFNIASYATLCHLLCKATGLELGELIGVFGDTHIYLNHLDQVREQLSRKPHPLPKLTIKKEVSSYQELTKLEWEDFELVNYQYHPPIKAPMAI